MATLDQDDLDSIAGLIDERLKAVHFQTRGMYFLCGGWDIADVAITYDQTLSDGAQLCIQHTGFGASPLSNAKMFGYLEGTTGGNSWNQTSAEDPEDTSAYGTGYVSPLSMFTICQSSSTVAWPAGKLTITLGGTTTHVCGPTTYVLDIPAIGSAVSAGTKCAFRASDLVAMTLAVADTNTIERKLDYAIATSGAMQIGGLVGINSVATSAGIPTDTRVSVEAVVGNSFFIIAVKPDDSDTWTIDPDNDIANVPENAYLYASVSPGATDCPRSLIRLTMTSQLPRRDIVMRLPAVGAGGTGNFWITNSGSAIPYSSQTYEGVSGWELAAPDQIADEVITNSAARTFNLRNIVIDTSGHATDHGIAITPGSTGDGVVIYGGATGGQAVHLEAQAADAHGLHIVGNGASPLGEELVEQISGAVRYLGYLGLGYTTAFSASYTETIAQDSKFDFYYVSESGLVSELSTPIAIGSLGPTGWVAADPSPLPIPASVLLYITGTDAFNPGVLTITMTPGASLSDVIVHTDIPATTVGAFFGFFIDATTGRPIMQQHGNMVPPRSNSLDDLSDIADEVFNSANRALLIKRVTVQPDAADEHAGVEINGDGDQPAMVIEGGSTAPYALRIKQTGGGDALTIETPDVGGGNGIFITTGGYGIDVSSEYESLHMIANAPTQGAVFIQNNTGIGVQIAGNTNGVQVDSATEHGVMISGASSSNGLMVFGGSAAAHFEGNAVDSVGIRVTGTGSGSGIDIDSGADGDAVRVVAHGGSALYLEGQNGSGLYASGSEAGVAITTGNTGNALAIHGGVGAQAVVITGAGNNTVVQITADSTDNAGGPAVKLQSAGNYGCLEFDPKPNAQLEDGGMAVLFHKDDPVVERISRTAGEIGDAVWDETLEGHDAYTNEDGGLPATAKAGELVTFWNSGNKGFTEQQIKRITQAVAAGAFDGIVASEWDFNATPILTNLSGYTALGTNEITLYLTLGEGLYTSGTQQIALGAINASGWTQSATLAADWAAVNLESPAYSDNEWYLVLGQSEVIAPGTDISFTIARETAPMQVRLYFPRGLMARAHFVCSEVGKFKPWGYMRGATEMSLPSDVNPLTGATTAEYQGHMMWDSNVIPDSIEWAAVDGSAFPAGSTLAITLRNAAHSGGNVRLGVYDTVNGWVLNPEAEIPAGRGWLMITAEIVTQNGGAVSAGTVFIEANDARQCIFSVPACPAGLTGDLPVHILADGSYEPHETDPVKVKIINESLASARIVDGTTWTA